jgi:catechol 2,3-dioxygenase-like lactoylglutathione lyase family enzyme
MFSHITLGTNDIEKAKAFYDATLTPLGLARLADFPEAAGYGPAGGKPPFWILRPIDKQPATVANGLTIGFDAPTRRAVDAAYAAARAKGAKDEGAPGLRPHYHANYYGAYVRDLDGNKLCIVCHRPE